MTQSTINVEADRPTSSSLNTSQPSTPEAPPFMTPEDLRRAVFQPVLDDEGELVPTVSAEAMVKAQDIILKIPKLIHQHVLWLRESGFRAGAEERVDLYKRKCRTPCAPGYVHEQLDEVAKILIDYCRDAGLSPRIWQCGRYNCESYIIQALFTLDKEGTVAELKD